MPQSSSNNACPFARSVYEENTLPWRGVLQRLETAAAGSARGRRRMSEFCLDRLRALHNKRLVLANLSPESPSLVMLDRAVFSTHRACVFLDVRKAALEVLRADPRD